MVFLIKFVMSLSHGPGSGQRVSMTREVIRRYDIFSPFPKQSKSTHRHWKCVKIWSHQFQATCDSSDTHITQCPGAGTCVCLVLISKKWVIRQWAPLWSWTELLFDLIFVTSYSYDFETFDKKWVLEITSSRTQTSMHFPSSSVSTLVNKQGSGNLTSYREPGYDRIDSRDKINIVFAISYVDQTFFPLWFLLFKTVYTSAWSATFF